MPCLEISAPLTLMWLFGRLFMDIIVSVTVLARVLFYLYNNADLYVFNHEVAHGYIIFH